MAHIVKTGKARVQVEGILPTWALPSILVLRLSQLWQRLPHPTGALPWVLRKPSICLVLTWPARDGNVRSGKFQAVLNAYNERYLDSNLPETPNPLSQKSIPLNLQWSSVVCRWCLKILHPICGWQNWRDNFAKFL